MRIESTMSCRWRRPSSPTCGSNCTQAAWSPHSSVPGRWIPQSTIDRVILFLLSSRCRCNHSKACIAYGLRSTTLASSISQITFSSPYPPGGLGTAPLLSPRLPRPAPIQRKASLVPLPPLTAKNPPLRPASPPSNVARKRAYLVRLPAASVRGTLLLFL